MDADVKFASLPRISLTTVRQPACEIGREAVRILLDEIEKKNSKITDTDKNIKKIVLKPELVIRNTCGYTSSNEYSK